MNNQIDITQLPDGAIIDLPEGSRLLLDGIRNIPVTISKHNGLVNLGNTSMSEPSIQWQSDDELFLNAYQGCAAMYRNLFFKNKPEEGCRMPVGLTRLSEYTISSVPLQHIAKYLERCDGISEIHLCNGKLYCTDGYVWFRMTPMDKCVYLHVYFKSGRPGVSHWNCRVYHGEMFYERLIQMPMDEVNYSL